MMTMDQRRGRVVTNSLLPSTIPKVGESPKPLPTTSYASTYVLDPPKPL